MIEKSLSRPIPIKGRDVILPIDMGIGPNWKDIIPASEYIKGYR